LLTQSSGPYPTRLTATRASQLSGREFERLTKLTEAAVADLGDKLGELTSSVRNAPGRCIVQIGNAALTISWVRTIRDDSGDARLMVLEWDGTIERNPDVIPERTLGRPGPRGTARLVRETAFSVDADDDAHWYWRKTDDKRTQFESERLAATFIKSLLQRARSGA